MKRIIMMASTASINLTGRVRLGNASSGTIVATAGWLESTLTKNADGSCGYTLVGNGCTTLARKPSDTVMGYVHLVANDNDTLREIAIKSWSGTVPTNYVVQRDLSITVPSRFISDTGLPSRPRIPHLPAPTEFAPIVIVGLVLCFPPPPRDG
jgi:hypothetical protein